MAEKSGMTFYEAQAALGRVYLGSDALETELEKNKTVTFALGIAGAEKINLDDKKDKAKNAAPTVTVEMPRDYEEAWARVRRFQSADPVDERIADSVAHHAMMGTGSILEEPWTGDEESERLAYVTEELYIHSSSSLLLFPPKTAH